MRALESLLVSAENTGVNSIAVLCAYGDQEELQNYTNVIFSDALGAINYLSNRKNQHTLSG